MLVTVSHLSGTVIQVSCDGYSGCTASFVATQPGAFDRECAEEFARAMGWVFRADGQALCRECAERADDARRMSIAAH
jgi:hypothetical protein